MVVDGNEVYEERHAAHHTRHEKGTQQHLTDPHLACTTRTVISTTSSEALNRGLSPASVSYKLCSHKFLIILPCCTVLTGGTMISVWLKCSNDRILPHWIAWSQYLWLVPNKCVPLLVKKILLESTCLSLCWYLLALHCETEMVATLQAFHMQHYLWCTLM